MSRSSSCAAPAVRPELDEALARVDAELPLCACRSGSATDTAHRRSTALHRSGRADACRWPRAAAATEAEVDGAVAEAAARPRTVARGERRGPRRALMAAAALDARAPAGAGRARGPRMRQAVARGRRRRVRGDRLPGVLRARRDRARPSGRELLQVPGERNELRYAPRGVVARDLPVELPARDPLRDDRRGAGDRQRGRAQAGRAVARAARCGWCRRCAPAASRRTRSRCCPARATSAPRWSAIPSVHDDRVHRLAAGRPRDRARRGRDAARASATSSGWSPSWAARTA